MWVTKRSVRICKICTWCFLQFLQAPGTANGEMSVALFSGLVTYGLWSAYSLVCCTITNHWYVNNPCFFVCLFVCLFFVVFFTDCRFLYTHLHCCSWKAQSKEHRPSSTVLWQRSCRMYQGSTLWTARWGTHHFPHIWTKKRLKSYGRLAPRWLGWTIMFRPTNTRVRIRVSVSLLFSASVDPTLEMFPIHILVLYLEGKTWCHIVA